MSSGLPMSCPSCGQIVGTGGGRCPSCGEMLPETRPLSLPPQVSQLAPGVLVRRAEERRSSAVAAVVLGGAVLAIATLGGVGWVLLAKKQADGSSSAPTATTSAPKAPSGPTNPDDMGVTDLAAADPSGIATRAHARARAWDPNALLVSLEATPVASGGKVDVRSGGKVELVFAKPAGERLGPGAPTGASQLVVRVDANGSKVTEQQGQGGTGVDDPNCPIGDAWRKMVASGVPSSSAVTMRYVYGSKNQKPVWQTSSTDDTKLSRTLDGWTCTILIR